MDAMLSMARGTLDPANRKAMYARIAKKALEDAPYIFLTYREQGYAYKKSVEGFRILPGFMVFYTADSLEAVTLTN